MQIVETSAPGPAIPRLPKVLGSVVCTPATAAVGESVLVEVMAPDGKPYDNQESTPILINGTPGSKFYLVWNKPGNKKIVVLAGHRGAIEKMYATVTITAAPANMVTPKLQIRQRVDEPGIAEFTLLNMPGFTLLGKPSRTPRITTLPQAAPPQLKPVRPPAKSSGGPATPHVAWDFGNGHSEGSARGFTSHDYTSTLDFTQPRSVFHVVATVQNGANPPLVVRRSVVVRNAYYFSKQRGVLQPPLEDASLNTTFINTLGLKGYSAQFSVRNPEKVDMVLSSLRHELFFENAASPFQMLAAESANVTLKANEVTKITMFVPQAKVPKDAIGITAHYSGQGPGKLPVRIRIHFDIPEHLSDAFSLSPAASKALQDLAVKNLISHDGRVTASDLKELDRRGLLPIAPADRLIPTAHLNLIELGPGSVVTLSSHQDPPFPVEGDPCEPWNLPDHIPDGMFCMPTAQTEQKKMPARFMNAKKGDIILSPGDGSLISMVLNSVDPPQRFSHSGIMTRNLDEITHSTAAEERLTDKANNLIGPDGVRPDVLKYLWPGVITQRVAESVDGESKVDPETGSTYTIKGFATMESKEDLGGSVPDVVPAMVVKPDPATETLELRQKLQKIADFAVQAVGNSHYRFFCFTDPTIGLTNKAPADARWAAGTFPTVCASLIWMAARQAGIPLEGGLEQKDLAEGAALGPNTADGLYLYTGEERVAAGEVLFEALKERVLETTSSLVDTFTDIQNNIANQVLNTFASDWADTAAKDSDQWRSTGDASAVSPENLTFYDAPLYGYSEPLMYREARIEEVTVYKWKRVLQTGTIAGVVRFNGQPMAGVSVQITQNQFTSTGADGAFQLTHVPVGSIIVDAQKVDAQGEYLSGDVNVTVQANQTAHVVINLALPAHTFRRIVIDGSLKTIDYEFAAAADPGASADFYGVVDLSPVSVTHAEVHYDCVADADILGRLILSIDLLDNDTVRVKPTIRCYDSAKDDTNDFDEGSLDSFLVGPEGHSHWSLYVDGENYAEAYFHIKNVVHQS